jgi:hypothetical protein
LGHAPTPDPSEKGNNQGCKHGNHKCGEGDSDPERNFIHIGAPFCFITIKADVIKSYVKKNSSRIIAKVRSPVKKPV